MAVLFQISKDLFVDLGEYVDVPEATISNDMDVRWLETHLGDIAGLDYAG